MADYNPNAGENQTHFSGNTEGGRTASMDVSSGVQDGLSMAETLGDSEIKNGEPMVTQNQRPKSYQKKTGQFTCGT